MVTKKFKYIELYTIKNEINGISKTEENNTEILLVGLKNEDVSQGIAIKLNKIVKKIEEEFKILQEQLDPFKDKEEENKDKINSLWTEEVEITFEELDIDKLDFRRKDNSYNMKYDYTELIEKITK